MTQPMPQDDSIHDGIESMRPTDPIDETPRGRLAGIQQDTYLTYREMYDLLTKPPVELDPDAYTERLHDLAGTLSDLHRRSELRDGIATFDRARIEPRPAHGPQNLMELRYPPDGDVERWVCEGPTGHKSYHGGPVSWEVSE